MPEPIEETRRNAIEQCRKIFKAYRARRQPLAVAMSYEYAMARLWHIETGKPLPPYSDGTNKVDGVQKMQSQGLTPARPGFRRRVIESAHNPPVGDGLKQLRDAWYAAGRPEVCLDEIRSSK